VIIFNGRSHFIHAGRLRDVGACAWYVVEDDCALENLSKNGEVGDGEDDEDEDYEEEEEEEDL
jgi:hypothetical protein